MRSVLFVCTANICRSPMAEGVLRALLAARGIDPQAVHVESAGTHDYREGMPPAQAAVAAAQRRGYVLGVRPARRLSPADFDRFDHILAMDRTILASLRTLCPTRCKNKVELLLEYGDEHHGEDIPDPFGGPPEEFERALDLIEDGCRGLAQLIARTA